MIDEAFKYCPHCSKEGIIWCENKFWRCHHCGFIYYHNMAAAVGAVLLSRGEILLTVRKHDPCKGMFDLPGGFVDHHETLEQALTREVKEELNLDVMENDWCYLFSLPNRYEYAKIPYYTSDSFFLKEYKTKPDIVTGDDVAAATWIEFKDISLNLIGMNSMRNAVQRLKAYIKG